METVETTSTSDASSATSSDSANLRHKQATFRPPAPNSSMAKKLQWSLIEAKIELMREKANLVREQVQTQKEITRGTLLKNRLMELEIEKIEEEREQEKNAPKNSVVHGRIIGIDPGIQREEPPDKRPRRQASRGSSATPASATATVTIATVQGPPPDLGNLRSAIQHAQSSSARATPHETTQTVRESSVVSENLNSIVESINFYEASASSSQLYGHEQDSLDSTGFMDNSQLGTGSIQKIEPTDEFSMDYGEAGTSSGYVDPQAYLQSLNFGSSAGPSVPNTSMDMDAVTWRITQFEPFLNQTPAGAELVQTLSQGVSLAEKQRICLVRMLSGYLRNVCKNPARGPDVPERKQCVDKLFEAYPQLGIDSNKVGLRTFAFNFSFLFSIAFSEQNLGTMA
jgi:hypothetical protein